MDVASFAEIEDKFKETTERVIWCTVTTIDRQNRPRSRILHPIWDGATGWIATGRESLKAKHIAHNPFVSLSYWDQQHHQVQAECKAEWADDQAAKDQLWNLLKTTAEPVGYDPVAFWPSAEDPSFGALKLTPWRIEIWSVGAMSSGEPPQVWRQDVS